MLVGLVVVGRGGLSTLAQEGTPSADEFAPPEGVSFTPLGFGTAEQLPATPAEFALFRLGFDPGASFSLEASDPSAALVYIETGALTVRVEVPITVTRAATIAASSTPGADPNAVPMPEEMAAGTEFTMEAGDSAYFPPSIAGEARNDGQETATILIANIEPQRGGEGGTPTP
jgi:quercetin dioxygenase-like cupin family protein